MFLKNKNIIFKISRSKVTDYAALNHTFQDSLPLKLGNLTESSVLVYDDPRLPLSCIRVFVEPY